MTRPDKVNILGIEYAITYVDKPSDVDIYKRKALWGQIDYWTRTIRIYDEGNRPDEDLWQSILHEVLHGIVEALHMKMADDGFEDEIDLLALALTDVLFRNGWIGQ